MATTEKRQPSTASPEASREPIDTPFRRTLRRFRRHRLAVVGLVTVVTLVVLAIIGSEAAAYKQHLGNGNAPPSAANWLGTDSIGRDVLARTLVGGRVSLLVGLVAVLVSTVIGTVLGALAGFYRGLDFVVMRIVDIVMSFPTIVLLLVAVSLIGPGIVQMMLMIGLLTWTVPCRIVRGQFLQLREADFVTAARVIGVPDRAIVARHILPNSLAPLLVYSSLAVASVVLLEAGLSYLGLGVQAPTPSWGNMLNAARSITTLERHPWEWVPPGLMTVTFVLAVNFVGDGLRDAFDPRSVHDR